MPSKAQQSADTKPRSRRGLVRLRSRNMKRPNPKNESIRSLKAMVSDMPEIGMHPSTSPTAHRKAPPRQVSQEKCNPSTQRTERTASLSLLSAEARSADGKDNVSAFSVDEVVLTKKPHAKEEPRTSPTCMKLPPSYIPPAPLSGNSGHATVSSHSDRKLSRKASFSPARLSPTTSQFNSISLEDSEPPPLQSVLDESLSSFSNNEPVQYKESFVGKTNSPNMQECAPPVEVEVEPGLFETLRGSQETYQAVLDGSARRTICWSCSARLECVPDCQLVICPDCRIISPIDLPPNDIYRPFCYGVGLGFKQP